MIESISRDEHTSGKGYSRQVPTRLEDLRTSLAVRNALVVLATIAIILFLQWGAVFLIPFAVAVFVTFWLMPLVERLQRMHVPRAFGALLVLSGLVGTLGITGYALRDDADAFVATFPDAVHRARYIFNQVAEDPNGWLHHIGSALNDRKLVEAKIRPVIVPGENMIDMQGALVHGSTTLIVAVANVGAILFLIYLMLASGDLFKRKLLLVISDHAASGHLARKRVTVEILNEIAVCFQRYLGLLAFTNIAIGLVTWAAFFALGVEHAAIWGLIAAVLHVIPYAGPAITAIASLLFASFQFDSLSHGLLIALTSVLISVAIGMLLATWLASRASNMNSVAVFVGLMFWGWVWGIPGLLLGTPLMMASKVVADRIECLNWLGIFLGDAPKREHKPVRIAAATTAATVAIAEAACVKTTSENERSMRGGVSVSVTRTESTSRDEPILGDIDLVIETRVIGAPYVYCEAL